MPQSSHYHPIIIPLSCHNHPTIMPQSSHYYVDIKKPPEGGLVLLSCVVFGLGWLSHHRNLILEIIYVGF